MVGQQELLEIPEGLALGGLREGDKSWAETGGLVSSLLRPDSQLSVLPSVTDLSSPGVQAWAQTKQSQGQRWRLTLF